jgi:hypothetical protein
MIRIERARATRLEYLKYRLLMESKLEYGKKYLVSNPYSPVRNIRVYVQTKDGMHYFTDERGKGRFCVRVGDTYRIRWEEEVPQ